MLTILVWIVAFAITITIHEASHAWMSNKLGDPTARLLGRLSLNPLKHYDPVGTTLLLVLVILRSVGVPVIPFGWAKPVPVDPYNLKDERKDSAIIALAGPFANIFLSTLLAIIIRIFPSIAVIDMLYPVILLNVSLAIFNLLPIHPLDGGKILAGILPRQEAAQFERFMLQYGTLFLFLLIFPFGGGSFISSILSPIINLVINLLIPAIGKI